MAQFLDHSRSEFYNGPSADFNRLLSSPLTLYWNGWTTTTAQLQQAGWQLSCVQDVSFNSLQIALKLEQGGPPIYGMSDRIAFDYMRNLRDFAYSATIRVNIRSIAHAVYREMFNNGAKGFSPINADPMYSTQSRTQSIEDFAHFAPAIRPENQIIIPDESVEDLLIKINQMQEPERQAHLKRELQREKDNNPMTLQAQIISFKRAA